MSDNNVMLVAGGGGGKSTFIGGLFHTARNSDAYDATYSVEIGDTSEISTNVFGRMISTRRYPEKTDEAAIVRIDIEGSGFFDSGVTVEFIDIPGEQQQEIITTELMNDIEAANLNPAEIREAYRNKLASKMKQQDTSLEPRNDEYDKLYRHSYIKSDKIVFLLNLHKVLHNDEHDGLAYSAGAIRKVAKTRPTALVISALDTLPNAPNPSDDGDGGGESLSDFLDQAWQGATADDEVVEFLDTRLQAIPDVDAVLQEAKTNTDIDLFGVSVPAEDPTVESGHLKPDGVGFETRGFEAVIDWINN